MRHGRPESRSRHTKWLVALAIVAIATLASRGNAAALVYQSESGDNVTYSQEVARIMQDNCQICHQEGQIGPMPFTTYQEVRRY